MPDHAVGLCNARKTAERKQGQYRVEKKMTTPVNATGDFQQAIAKTQKYRAYVVKWRKGDIQQIEKDHVTTQPADTGQTGDNGTVDGG